MLLAVDIGNTNIKMGLFKGKRLMRTWRLATNKAANLKYYTKLLRKLLAKQKADTIDEVIICSVVPKLTRIVKRALFLILKTKPLVLGEDIPAPIKNLYKKPKEVGQDRLANAAAAFKRYAGPVIVVDFGTAVTFDVVTARGGYLGGVIVPGMELSLRALTGKADLLPEVKLSRPKALLGRQTISSMRSGLVYGYSFMIEGILKELKKGLKGRPYVVSTGGGASLMLPYCRSINKINENLTLEGLMEAALEGRKSEKIIKKERK
ncbi:MAG: type III pantothenate kinase [Candidatus Omnitrophota bacterium]|nr:MAG: type III pantothenate kinase [Candidatus Omnitrophota bacterium]